MGGMKLETKVFKALCHETRLAMVEMLLNHSCCVASIAKKLKISEAAASQHLRILREAGLAVGIKKGYFTHYQINTDLLKSTADELCRMAERGKKGCCGHKCRQDREKKDE